MNPIDINVKIKRVKLAQLFKKRKELGLLIAKYGDDLSRTKKEIEEVRGFLSNKKWEQKQLKGEE